MSRKQKRMGPVGCFGQIENIKRQSLVKNDLRQLFYERCNDYQKLEALLIKIGAIMLS